MYLKSITIQGFKSFADKTELQFRSGITAVVGPNGSGKSNIADALRWVLGEQSVKQLRGGKMEDVIFAGTQFRKPVGQASVCLTLDNSCHTLAVPYNEVSVTRRLYRSGESEYLINNNVVRLRDIHELFMDTGIGREGYSMIGQGKIDAILSGKPEERRGLVEEAAGITKYKSRKEEGEKKLSNAQDNLDRVEDILSTYEERIGPLKLEKEKAQVYLGLATELKDLQVSVILSELEDLAANNQELLAEHGQLTAGFNAAGAQKQGAQERQEALEDELQELSEARGRSREEYYLSKAKADGLKAQGALLEERLRGLKERIALGRIREEELREGLAKDRAGAQAKEALLQEKESGLQEEISRYEALAEESQGLEERLCESEKHSAALKAQEEGLEQEITGLQTGLAELRAQRQYLLAKEESLQSLSQNYDASLALNREEADALNAQKRALHKDKGDLQEALSLENAAVAQAEAEVAGSGRALETLRRAIRDGQGREALLKNLEEAHEGYARSVRDLLSYLKKSKSELLKDTDILGDVIRTKPEYSVAVEAALGGYVGNVITRTDEQAKALIDILKKQGLGRCTFLPRNVIKANRMKLPEFSKVSVLGLAADLVETADPFRAIVDSILARTIVVRNMEDAVLAARETGYRVKIVTLEGDIIQGGGAMTGGSQKGRSAGVVSRKAELQSLAGELRKSLTELQELELLDEKKQRVLAEARTKALSLTQRLRGLELEETKLAERLGALLREVEKLEALQAGQSQSGESLMAEICLTQEEIQGLEAKLLERQAALATTGHALAALKERRRELFVTSDGMKDTLSDQRVRVSQWEKDTVSAKAELDRLREELQSKEGRRAELALETAALEGEVQAIAGQLEEKAREGEATLLIMAGLEKERDELDQKEVRARARLREAQGILDTARGEYYRLEKELLKVSLNLEKYESEQAELMARLNEDLELTLAEARDLRKPLESKSRAKKRIAEIRAGIAALGNVNLSALEEYRSVSEHYEFLSSQREDLLRSKEDLLTLIGEMTGKMRRLFNENFVILSRNFQETFSQLFNGGRAELVLGDGDVLTGSIDIQVQPPGKKLQNLNLLSGGEKVLSAIALTFAILRMKPSPFCFLDEIEAALDDANVYRYANFIQEYAKDTQFILITHRKGTMEAANMLYGVTMEEKGISKIVSVDLDHIEEEQTNG